jgi:hypothetical protein
MSVTNIGILKRLKTKEPFRMPNKSSLNYFSNTK